MTQEAISRRRTFVDEHVKALDLSIEAAQELFIAGRVTSLEYRKSLHDISLCSQHTYYV